MSNYPIDILDLSKYVLALGFIMMVIDHSKIVLIALKRSLNTLQGAQTVIAISESINVAFRAYSSPLKKFSAKTIKLIIPKNNENLPFNDYHYLSSNGNDRKGN